MKPERVTCPRCQQTLATGAEFCEACGLTLAELDSHFGSDEVVLAPINDSAGRLTEDDRKRVARALNRFEATFVRHFIAVHIGHLGSAAGLRQCGCWLLNRAATSAADFRRPNENGLLILVDPDTRVAGIVVGCQVEPWLTESQLHEIVEGERAHLRSGKWAAALERIVRRMHQALHRAWRSAARHAPSDTPDSSGGPLAGLARLRSRGGRRSAPTPNPEGEPRK